MTYLKRDYNVFVTTHFYDRGIVDSYVLCFDMITPPFRYEHQ